MPAIRGAQIVALYLFDIAETVDLPAISALVGGPGVAAKLAPKPATPPYLQYETPPLAFDGEVAGLGAIDDFAVRFRVYDYGVIAYPRWHDQWVGSRHANAARHVHSLFIDVNELTDRTENALKFIGDVYAARLFSLVSGRLGLAAWKANIQEKLETLDDIYRFSVEQSSMTRGQFLELTVVLILVLELVLILLGVMK